MAMSAELADQIIAAGTRAADSERKLRRLVERIEHLIETHQTTDGALRSALKDAKAP